MLPPFLGSRLVQVHQNQVSPHETRPWVMPHQHGMHHELSCSPPQQLQGETAAGPQCLHGHVHFWALNPCRGSIEPERKLHRLQTGEHFCAHLLSLLSHAEVTTTASHRPKQTLVQPRLQLPGLCFCSSGTRTPAADVWRCAWHKLPAVPIESKGPWGDPTLPHRTCDTGRGDSTSAWATWYTRPSHLVGHAACTLTDMALTRSSQNVKG